MLYGYDVSMWQKDTPLDCDFLIIKATEGNGYTDPSLEKHLSNALKKKKLIGFYHYARPDLGNEPEAEADWFLQIVGKYAGQAIFALDWEGDSLRYSEDWLLRWCRRIKEKTGVKPLIYISAGQCYKLRSAYYEDYGLWVAHWGVYKPVYRGCYPLGAWALWQYQGSPIDRDVFNGDKRAWKAYCTARPLEEIE